MDSLSDAQKLRQGLDKLVEAIKDATADGRITLPEIGRIFGIGATVVNRLVDTLSDRQANFEPLVDELEAIYDQRIAKVDIPYLPAILERRIVHPVLRSFIRPYVAGIYSAWEGRE